MALRGGWDGRMADNAPTAPVRNRRGQGTKGPRVPGTVYPRPAWGAEDDLYASAPSATVAVLRGSAQLAPALPGLLAAAARGARIIR